MKRAAHFWPLSIVLTMPFISIEAAKVVLWPDLNPD